VSGQNSNNSVRVPNAFFDALDVGGDWNLRRRTDGETCKTLAAAKLWNDIALSAWECADPGVQYRAPPAAASTPRIRAPSTCSWTIRRATSLR
jgi:ribonucleotide reductase alpha subunit